MHDDATDDMQNSFYIYHHFCDEKQKENLAHLKHTQYELFNIHSHLYLVYAR